ncbi:MAG: FAD-dependent oxidoreductase [Sulfurimonas sp.]|jgi:succinate dehydrogenase / fumarate reductase flavoprotein subunit|nr:FAD-dependent oxidoreductase [Sulfurimonadaceae bacterium]
MKQVIIIGAGGAGLCAALGAKEQGAKVTVITKEYPTRSQTSMAQGGINGVLNSANDSIQSHIADTLKSSQNLASHKQIEFMCHEAPKAIEWLDTIGVNFSKDEQGNIAQRKLGGASGVRACYAKDYTGLKILHTLYDRCLKEGVEFLNEHHLLEILTTTNSDVIGVSVLDKLSGEVKVLSSSVVVLATGGFAKLYAKHSTNSVASSGDGVAIAHRAGAKLKHMEFVQFHPTALKGSSILISESARGAGGYLINSKGERFVDELLGRDVVSRAIDEQIKNSQEVFLDISHLSEEFIKQELPQEYKLAKLYEGVDATKNPIPIKPAAHYTMGGIEVDSKCRTNIKGLFAVGECAEHGVHGANRLGGNSLLEIVVFGRVAGKEAAKEAKDELCEASAKSIDYIFEYENSVNFYQKRDELSEIFYNYVGLVRDEAGLKKALSFVKETKANINKMGVSDKHRGFNTNLSDFLEFINLLDIAEVVANAALANTTNIGANYRSDGRSL